MKFRKGAVADVLWFISIVMIFIIVTRNRLEFSNTATIDAYVKNIANTEITRFVSSITGYSTSSDSCNMYNSKGDKREFGSSSDMASSLNDDNATANGIFNKAKAIMIENIKNEFNNNQNLKTRTTGVEASNVYITMSEPTGRSTVVTVTVRFTVVGGSYTAKDGGFVEQSKMTIPRKVVVTRTIENPLRFK